MVWDPSCQGVANPHPSTGRSARSGKRSLSISSARHLRNLLPGSSVTRIRIRNPGQSHRTARKRTRPSRATIWAWKKFCWKKIVSNSKKMTSSSLLLLMMMSSFRRFCTGSSFCRLSRTCSPSWSTSCGTRPTKAGIFRARVSASEPELAGVEDFVVCSSCKSNGWGRRDRCRFPEWTTCWKNCWPRPAMTRWLRASLPSTWNLKFNETWLAKWF